MENEHEPSIYNEVIGSGDHEKWVSAMQEEMQSVDKNGPQEVVRLPKQKLSVQLLLPTYDFGKRPGRLETSIKYARAGYMSVQQMLLTYDIGTARLG